MGTSTNPGEQVHRALVEINGTGEEHRALRLGVDPRSAGHGCPFEDAPQDGGRCQVRVEVILVRPGRAKVAEVDTVGDDPRHLCQVTAYAIPGSVVGLGNPDPRRRQIRGQRDGVGERRIGLREHDLLCGEEIRQLALEGPDGEVSFSRQYRDQGLPEVASPRPDSARHAADREERLRLCRMVETAAEAITRLCGEGSEPTVTGGYGEPPPDADRARRSVSSDLRP